LTGWTIKSHFWLGEFEFDQEIHDQGKKFVLGERISPAGMAEAEGILYNLALHPATAHRLAVKLVRRFVTDDPERQAPALVEAASRAFLNSAGDIKAMLKAILLDGVVGNPSVLGPKFKRPVDFMTSALRIFNAETTAKLPLQKYLDQMGQPPFGWPMPDGPNDLTRFWSSNLLPRWKFALAVSGEQIEGTEVEVGEIIDSIPTGSNVDRMNALSVLILGRALADPIGSALGSTLDALNSTDGDYVNKLLLASLLASPEFQWR
jgi:uncharacterized protein (DUF1800 family)